MAPLEKLSIDITAFEETVLTLEKSLRLAGRSSEELLKVMNRAIPEVEAIKMEDISHLVRTDSKAAGKFITLMKRLAVVLTRVEERLRSVEGEREQLLRRASEARDILLRTATPGEA